MRKDNQRLVLQKALLQIEQELKRKGISAREFCRRYGLKESRFSGMILRPPAQTKWADAHIFLRGLLESGWPREELLKLFGPMPDIAWLFALACIDLPVKKVTTAFRQDIVRALWDHFRKSGVPPLAPRPSPPAGSD